MIQLHQGEEIFLSQRKHWFALVAESVSLFVAAIVPFFVLWLSMMGEGTRGFVVENTALVVFSIAAWELILWVVFFILWTNYYLNLLVVTNVRIIDVEQHGLFARDMADLRLDRIQDVKIEVMGIMASLLDFGDIHIQSAGASREVVASRMRNPYKVRDVILKAQHNKLNRRYNHAPQNHSHDRPSTPYGNQSQRHYESQQEEQQEPNPHSPHHAAKKHSRWGRKNKR